MFQLNPGPDRRYFRLFAIGLAVLSLTALTVTIWILFDVQREQEIVAGIIRHLPDSDLAVARELSGDLRLHSRLSFLLVLNIIGTAIALALVGRAYLSSQRSLQDVKVLATDILASMDSGVITTNRAGTITSINPCGRDLIDVNENCLGQSLADIDPRHAMLNRIRSEVNAGHSTARDRDYCVTRSGQKQTLRVGCTFLRNQRAEEIGTVIHIRDVTQKVLLEERLLRMERYVGLGSLAAGLQHEIKNPLSALSLHLQLLSERLEQDQPSADVCEMLEILRAEVNRISDVLDGFRNYASVTALGRSSVDVVALIQKLARLLRPQAESQGIRIQIQLPDTAVDLIQADSVQLEQVLLNLALNSVAAMPEGGLLTFQIRQQAELLRIDVRDTGHGIPTEIQTQIFDPYFTTRKDGTGMGLALCDKIVRQHGGSLEFRTGQPGDGRSGTEFTVTLPLNGSE